MAKRKKKKSVRAKVKAKAKARGAARKGASVARKPGDFYPPIKPFDTGVLRVSPVHEIYYEQSGNPKGKPVVFLHGGSSSTRRNTASFCSISEAAARASRRRTSSTTRRGTWSPTSRRCARS
jgi:hypothetical protein